jgi:hypothetical protein
LAASELQRRRATIKRINKRRARGRSVLNHDAIVERKVGVRTDNGRSTGGLISQNLSP